MTPATPHDLLPFGFRDQVGERLPSGHMGERATFGRSALPLTVMRCFRKLGQLLPLAGSHDEQPGSGLRNAVVRSVQHLPVARIAGRLDLLQQSRERRSTRLVVEGECVDVLQDEEPRPSLSEDARVRLEQAGGRVNAVTLPVEPETGLREGDARRSTDEEIRLLASTETTGAQDVAGRDLRHPIRSRAGRDRPASPRASSGK